MEPDENRKRKRKIKKGGGRRALMESMDPPGEHSTRRGPEYGKTIEKNPMQPYIIPYAHNTLDQREPRGYPAQSSACCVTLSDDYRHTRTCPIHADFLSKPSEITTFLICLRSFPILSLLSLLYSLSSSKHISLPPLPLPLLLSPRYIPK